MIGTALIEAAVENSTEVYAIVRNNSKRMDRLIKSPLVHVVYGDLSTLKDVRDIPFNCDALYHFAWSGTSKAERDDPLIQEENIKYSLDAVELAHRTGCKRFIGAGSQAEYGPTDEVIDCHTKFAPIISYGVTKCAANLLSRKLCEKYGIIHVWGRIFSVYGPHDNKGTMLECAISSWKRGETVHFSSGRQYWNYLYETDAGNMFYELGDESTPAGEYFVAGMDSAPLIQYIDVLRKTYGKGANAIFADSDSSKLPGLNVDMSETKERLKYVPKVPFEVGIKRMIDAIR